MCDGGWFDIFGMRLLCNLTFFHFSSSSRSPAPCRSIVFHLCTGLWCHFVISLLCYALLCIPFVWCRHSRTNTHTNVCFWVDLVSPVVAYFSFRVTTCNKGLYVPQHALWRIILNSNTSAHLENDSKSIYVLCILVRVSYTLTHTHICAMWDENME